MLINDKVDAVYIPDSPSRIKATDYNQIKNEIQECITEAGLTPTKDVIQLPQALKILTAQSGAEEVAKIEAAGQEQLDAINTAGAQAVQDAQTAANTATAKATEAAGSASAAASSASAASGSASTATTQAANAAASADQAADSAASIVGDAEAAAASATEASDSASAAAQSAQEAASSANLADIQNKITNCLTKIPQDINLELSADGTLTLKAGSKVYRGNGAVVNITQDISMTYPSSATILVCASASSNTLQGRAIENCGAGTSDPQTANSIYFDTAAKVVKFYPSAGGVGTEVSLPIAICTATGQISSIDQVFNGFGYIGNTMFALPGVEGLIPNGRNTDGTLKNTQVSVAAVKTLSFSNKTQDNFGLTATFLFSSKNSVYNEDDNKNFNILTGNYLGFCNCGTVETDTTGVITSLTPKTVFHAVDYNDLAKTDSLVQNDRIGFPNLSAKVSINSGYTAPSNGWVLIISSNSNANTEMKFDNAQVYFQGAAGSAAFAACGFIPIKKGQVVTITGEVSVKQFMPSL